MLYKGTNDFKLYLSQTNWLKACINLEMKVICWVFSLFHAFPNYYVIFTGTFVMPYPHRHENNYLINLFHLELGISRPSSIHDRLMSYQVHCKGHKTVQVLKYVVNK